MSSGIVFNIQKYSIHDGPGIRTTVFLKGCPLSCWWCHNPESQNIRPQLIFFDSRCIACGKCLKVCPENAISVENGVMKNDNTLCTSCGRCSEVCYAGARELAGKTMTTQEVMAEISKDMIFYEESGGGVTFSGGEPLMQPDFLNELLVSCHAKGIHTTIDTCGYGSSEALLEISKNTDLFLYDLKLIDEEKHKLYIGASNKLILENLELLSKQHKRIAIRIPLIPGINDTDEDIKAFAETIRKYAGIEKVHLLPYHGIAADKYRRLGTEYKLKDLAEPTPERMQELVEKFKAYGVSVKIGG